MLTFNVVVQIIYQNQVLRFIVNSGQMYVSIYIIQFVCLFVHDSRLNYAKYSHQSLRDYIDLPGRTTPRIGVTHPVVSMAFPIYFRYSLCDQPPYFNYFRFYARVAAAGGVRNINQWDTRVYTGKKNILERHD